MGSSNLPGKEKFYRPLFTKRPQYGKGCLLAILAAFFLALSAGVWLINWWLS